MVSLLYRVFSQIPLQRHNRLVAMLATSLLCRCEGIWETTRHNGFFPRQLVTDLLRGSYGKTGVMDFGLNRLLTRHMRRVNAFSACEIVVVSSVCATCENIYSIHTIPLKFAVL